MKTIASFVLLRSYINEHDDYISAFVPLVLQVLAKKNYSSVDIETLCADFLEEFGIVLSRYPLQTILNRMKRKYLRQSQGKFYINLAEVHKDANISKFRTEQGKFDQIINKFIVYCHTFDSPIDISQTEAEKLFMEFLKLHDLDMVFALNNSHRTSLLPNNGQIDGAPQWYMLNRFIGEELERDTEITKYLIDCAVGHICASAILFREFGNIRGKGVCKNCYLDTPIIFDIIGINGTFRKESTDEFLRQLSAEGTNLFVFSHNYENEVIWNLEDTFNWIDNPKYDPYKASRALHYFKENGFSKADIGLLIDRVPNILNELNISISPSLDPNLDTEYQINESRLQEIILEVYSELGWSFDEEEREETLLRDIKSISNIYKLRRGNTPRRINDVEHVFITSNSGLAYASKQFAKSRDESNGFTIPAILTDTFLGTLLWIQNPTQVMDEFNRAKLLHYSNSFIQPKPEVIERFQEYLEIAQNDPINPINENTAQLMLTSGYTRLVLTDITLNDPDAVTHQTPYELLHKLKQEILQPELQEKQVLLDELSKAQRDKVESEREAHALGIKSKEQYNKTTDAIKKTAKVIKWILAILVSSISLLLFYFDIFSEIDKLWLKILIYLLQVIPLLFGIAIVTIIKKFEMYIIRKLTSFFLSSDQNVGSEEGEIDNRVVENAQDD